MAIIEELAVEFDKGRNVIYAGEKMAGTTRIVVKVGGVELRSVKIRVIGKAATFWIEEYEWTDQTADLVKTEINSYSAQETYINLEQELWSEKEGEVAEKGLGEGTHIFPFEFQIPINASTSIEAPSGYVRYLLFATVLAPGGQTHVCKRAFTVIGLQDLNLDPMAKSPAQKRIGSKVGCWCFATGDVVCQFSIARRGFVAGEVIPIQGQISNSSSRTLKEVEIKLFQHVLYQGRPDGEVSAKPKTKRESRNVATLVRSEEIPPGELQLWRGQTEGVDALRIPPVPPMMLNCNVIKIQYELRVRIIPTGPFKSLEFSLPLIIGTIPLKTAIPELNRKYSVRPPTPTEDNYHFPESKRSYPELPPPMFQSCVFGRKSIVEKEESDSIHGDKEFAPKYAYYDWDKKKRETSS